ncbi:MAG TPA: hypothetical protein VHC20_07840 [Candidatus Paceibacterota bacterium]|nr:hypothetical protein [Candidatus Paceibacterota bacterium]
MKTRRSDTIPQWEDGAHDDKTRRTAERIWALLQQHPDIGPLLEKDGRTGVVACTAPVDHPKVKYKTLIGTAIPEKAAKYDFHAGEKVDRLYTHPKHIASSQSSDGKTKFKGAVRGKKYFWSISGLWPDDYDELFATLLAVAMGDLTKAEGYELLRTTKNVAARFFAGFLAELV